MITCKLYGGLGNQMFQIAVTVAHALKNGYEFFIPSKTVDESVWKSYFRFEGSEKLVVQSLKERKEGTYTPLPERDNVCLNGYFQSYKYFDHCYEDIVKLFDFPKEMMKGVVSIHVRRGDYMKEQHMFPFVGEKYLTDAVDYFKAKGYDEFLVFSDDIKWCKEFFKGKEYSFSENQSDQNDLSLMSQCEHNIISNSSFSVWAAYLNQNKDKIVIAPKTWFLHHDMKDICPLNWIRL